MSLRKPAVALLLAALALGSAHRPSQAESDSGYVDCLYREATRLAKNFNTYATPDVADEPGGPCEATRKAELAEIRKKFPDYNDEQANNLVDEIRNAIWTSTMKPYK